VYERDGEQYEEDLGVPQRLSDRPGDREILEAGVVVVERVSDPGLHEETRESMARWSEKTCLNVPLLFRGESVGLMMLLDHDREREFDDEDLALARTIGEQVAVGFQNARLSRALQRRSESDPVTGLANARTLRQRLGGEVVRAQRHGMPLSLLSLELDDFRSYVVEHGRPAANELLKAVGRLVARPLHAGIDLAARYGGEKFVVVLPHTPLQTSGGEAGAAAGAQGGVGAGPHTGAAAGLAERLRDEIAAMTTDTGGELLPRHVSVSVGVAEFGPEAADGDTLLAAADAALAAARGIGGNSVQTHA